MDSELLALLLTLTIDKFVSQQNLSYLLLCLADSAFWLTGTKLG